MLQVSIKDTNTNEVIYDNEVSAIIMQAVENDDIRSIQNFTADASVTDIIRCIEATKKAVSAASRSLTKAIDAAIEHVLLDINKTNE